jgi:hypothetical protein|tara:strand:- start:1936 stop:2394 length:459 start_codon:yes stop_codon:yes gene_type:complete
MKIILFLLVIISIIIAFLYHKKYSVVVEGNLEVNPQANYVDSIELNTYNEKLNDLMKKLSETRQMLNKQKISEFMKIKCFKKEPPTEQRIGITDDSEIFTITTEKEGPLINNINIEVPIGKQGPQGPEGDKGNKGLQGDKGPIGETGNCGNV